MTATPRRPRYTLDQAANLHRKLVVASRAECPDCGRPVDVLKAPAGSGSAIWIVQCQQCERAVVIEEGSRV